MTTAESPTQTAPAARHGVSARVSVIMPAAAALIFAGAATLAGFGFSKWVAAHDAIVFPAEENSTAPHYPAGHMVIGWSLGLSLILFAAVAAAAVIVVMSSTIRWTLWRGTWAIVLAGLVGLMPAAAIWSSVPVAFVLVVPAVAAAWCFARRSHARQDAYSQLSTDERPLTRATRAGQGSPTPRDV
ncbi:hypothetical protein ACFOYW_06235 [Gryllotalpicola reticulitermitis]|uniref:Uncharacterized protein n=1 Tax=Gryllotalpicola reticulitermitis TaxID=1184153 RepID=A0ABV8Q6H8_9MICO